MSSEPSSGEDSGQWLSVEEAASRLNVKKETIYAYVSRGRLTKRKAPHERGSVFSADEIDRLSKSGRQESRGLVEVESSITLVTEAGHYYRGQEATELADSVTFEELAHILWSAQAPVEPWTGSAEIEAIARRVVQDLPPSALPVDEIKLVFACISSFEPPEWNASPSVIASAARRAYASALSALPERSLPAIGDADAPWLAAMLWSRLCDRPPKPQELRLLNGAMIILADHDLASATLLARMAARAGVNASGVIRLGADVGSGPVKGAASLAIESFLRNLESPDRVESALMMRLRQGEPIPGFGHSVYPAGDPRADYILNRLRETAPSSQRLETVEELLKTQRRRGIPPPNAGFGIAAMTYVLDMVPGAGEAIFVMSRAAGWIAHAIEEYGLPMPKRQSARYVGPPV